jgi:UDP-N-acetylglucosamine:LPS N-acetylglucosamine transferase
MNKQILFFSRGMGRGHAIPDIAIANELRAMDSGIEVLFVSYASGAAVLCERGQDLIDLQLPEDNPLWDTAVRVNNVLRHRQPSLVVSHEEFVVVPLAKSLDLPVIFLTDWLGAEEWLNMQALRYADEVIFLDDAGYYDEPSYLKGRITYTGFVFRDLNETSVNRDEARAALKLPENAKVILVLPGGASFHSEARAPICDLLFGAIDLLALPQRFIIWVADGADYELLQRRSAERDDLAVMKPHRDLTRTIIASDLIVTKGNRTPLLECEVLGIPSISLFARVQCCR